MAEQILVNFLAGLASAAVAKTSFEGLKSIFDLTLKKFKYFEEISNQRIIEIDVKRAIIQNEIKLFLIQKSGKWIGDKYYIKWYPNQSLVNVNVYDGVTNRELPKQVKDNPTKRKAVVKIEDIKSPYIKVVYRIEERDLKTIKDYVAVAIDYKNRDLYNLNVTIEIKNNTSFFIDEFPVRVDLSFKELGKEVKIIMGALGLRDRRARPEYIDKKLEDKIYHIINKYEHRPLVEQIKRMTFGTTQPATIAIEWVKGSPKAIRGNTVNKADGEPYFMFYVNLKPFQSGAYRLKGLRENLGIDLIESRERQKKASEKERFR